MPNRLVVLASGEGTLLAHLIDACATGQVNAEIVAVGADRFGAKAIRRAQAAGIATFVCRVADHQDRDAWDRALTQRCAQLRPDLIVSAGFMKLFGPVFLGEFSGRCINSHPALLPSFPGMHGVRDALAYGVKVTGCTVFLVDSGLDSGPIVAQAAVPVHDGDDEEILTERVKVTERVLLVQTVAAMIAGGWSVCGRQVKIGSQEGESTGAPGCHHQGDHQRLRQDGARSAGQAAARGRGGDRVYWQVSGRYQGGWRSGHARRKGDRLS